ncbi:hypothetical protein ABIC35_000915 [Sphingomonas trueperi]
MQLTIHRAPPPLGSIKNKQLEKSLF